MVDVDCFKVLFFVKASSYFFFHGQNQALATIKQTIPHSYQYFACIDRLVLGG